MGVFKPAPAVILKSTPPRIVRGFLDRERLHLNRVESSGAQVTALLAPTGYGKTSQLNYWRRAVLGSGGLAFWLTLDNKDDPRTFIRGLAYTAQLSCGKRAFDEDFISWIESCTDHQDAITGWLAEIADLSVEVVLLLDDVDRLPTVSRQEVLTYLLGNAPANLHVVLAARPAGALVASGALRTARINKLNATDLRLRLEETQAVLSSALGGRCNLDAAAVLHELTEGWPFGVQLAAASLYRSGDLEGLIGAATEDIRRYFIDTVIDRQSADAVHLLTRLSHFDLIHTDMCASLFNRSDMGDILLQLQDETPLLTRSEDGGWMRLHPLAREVLAQRLTGLPDSELRALSRKASAWYAANGLPEQAAQQAFLAGDIATALDLVETCTHDMTVQGKSSMVLAWYRRLSQEQLCQHPGFWSSTAWALAMSEHSGQAQPLVDRIRTDANLSQAQQFEAMLIECTAAGFADRADDLRRKVLAWPEPPTDARPGDIPIHLISKGLVALYSGQPDQTRQQLARIQELNQQSAFSPVSYGLADYAMGLTYLWEGRYGLAEQVLRPALNRAEERLGRQSPVACLIAALLSQACWDGVKGCEPEAFLAGRLPVLERFGLPDALIAAYRTLARVADHEGRQDQAFDLLASLNAIGEARSMLRLQVAAKFELVRIHARHGRHETAQRISQEMDNLIQMHQGKTAKIYTDWLHLNAHLARAYALSVQQDGHALGNNFAEADLALQLSLSMKRGNEEVEARLLRADALSHQQQPEAHSMMLEAISLAQAGGMLRTLRELQGDKVAVPASSTPLAKAPPAQDEAYAKGAALLTGKEREVLVLLSRSMSNKEIARAMVVSEETIKWHMKNLFSKLNAAGRKHVVARARVLGLVD
ncbi:LuxR C-terminal-related transcriptional regulator [Pseudomonas putida]